MSDATLTTYAEMADVLESLPLLLREARRSRQLTMRGAATQIGVAYSTVHRIEATDDSRLSSVIPVLRWLAAPSPVAAGDPYQRTERTP